MGRPGVLFGEPRPLRVAAEPADHSRRRRRFQQRHAVLDVLRPEGGHRRPADPRHPLTYAPCGYKPDQLRGAYGIDDAAGQRARRPRRHGRHRRRLRVADDLRRRPDYAAAQRPAAPAARLQFSPDRCPATYSHADAVRRRRLVRRGDARRRGRARDGARRQHPLRRRRDCDDADLVAALNKSSTTTWPTSSPTPTATSARTSRRRAAGRTRPASRPRSRASACYSPPVTVATRSPTPASGRPTSRPPTRGDRRRRHRARRRQGQQQRRSSRAGGPASPSLTNGAWTPRPAGATCTAAAAAPAGCSRSPLPEGRRAGRARQRLGQAAAPGRPGRRDGRRPEHRLPGRPDPDVPRRRSTTTSTASAAPACRRPLFAGMMALADQVARRRAGFANPALRAGRHARRIRDVDHGRGYRAVVRVGLRQRRRRRRTARRRRCARSTNRHDLHPPGYDDVTGVGTPNGAAFFNGVAVPTCAALTGPTHPRTPAPRTRRRGALRAQRSRAATTRMAPHGLSQVRTGHPHHRDLLTDAQPRPRTRSARSAGSTVCSDHALRSQALHDPAGAETSSC